MKGSRTFLVAFLLMSAMWSPSMVSTQGATYTVSASILFCDTDPQDVAPEDREDVCGDAFAGTGITLSDPSGTIGSCITETIETPWGGTMNFCGIEGAGFDTTLTFTVDESTLPAGYTLDGNDLSVEVGTLIPGGGDQTTVTFMAIADDPPESPDAPAVQRETIGFNADLLTGTCDAPGESAAILQAVVAETGLRVGTDTGYGPETSVTVADIPLDTLIDEPHMISIYGVNDRAGNRILCGDIGGVDNDDGTLFVVLAPVEASIDAAGLAQLSYGADSGSETVIRLFVIPNG